MRLPIAILIVIFFAPTASFADPDWVLLPGKSTNPTPRRHNTTIEGSDHVDAAKGALESWRQYTTGRDTHDYIKNNIDAFGRPGNRFFILERTTRGLQDDFGNDSGVGSSEMKIVGQGRTLGEARTDADAERLRPIDDKNRPVLGVERFIYEGEPTTYTEPEITKRYNAQRGNYQSALTQQNDSSRRDEETKRYKDAEQEKAKKEKAAAEQKRKDEEVKKAAEDKASKDKKQEEDNKIAELKKEEQRKEAEKKKALDVKEAADKQAKEQKEQERESAIRRELERHRDAEQQKRDKEEADRIERQRRQTDTAFVTPEGVAKCRFVDCRAMFVPPNFDRNRITIITNGASELARDARRRGFIQIQ